MGHHSRSVFAYYGRVFFLSCRTSLYLVVAAALNAAHVQFTLPPFGGDPATAKGHAALEAQPEIGAAVGMPSMVPR